MAMLINSTRTEAEVFAFDGCHKIYLIESEGDQSRAISMGYSILPIELLPETFERSCDLRFIDNWSLTKTVVPQFEQATFTSVD